MDCELMNIYIYLAQFNYDPCVIDWLISERSTNGI